MASRNNNALNLSLGVDIEGFKKDFQSATKVTQGAARDIEKEAAKMALAVSKKIEGMNLNSQARQLQNLTARMMEAGLEGTKAFTQVAQSAGKLRANIDDAKGVIEAFRPDAPFKALSTTLGASAQAFAGVQGAMALFGAESENVQKTLLKVQAAMAFSEGFKALDGLQDGFTQLNLIIKANPLVAGAAVGAAIIGTIMAMADATAKVSDEQKALNFIHERSIELAQKEYGEVKALSIVLLDEGNSREVRNDALQKLQNQYPGYLDNLSVEKSTTEQIKAATDNLTSSILKRAKAQAAIEKLTELGKQELAVELARAELEKERFTGGGLDQAAWAKAIKGRENFINATQKQLNKEIEIYKNYLNSADDLFDNKAPSAPTGKTTAKPNIKPKTQPTTTSGTFLLGGENTFEKPAKNLYFVGMAAKNAATEIDGLDSTIKKTNTSIDAQTLAADKYRANMEVVGHGVANAFDMMGDAISDSMMRAAGDSATAFDAFKAQIVETIVKLAGMAMANAIVGATQSGTATGPAAIFTTPAFIAAAIGGITSAFAAAASFRPSGFASGGLIPGNSFTGDRLLAPVNSGEVVLNTGQQNQLLRLANGRGGGERLITKINGRDLMIILKKSGDDYKRG